MTDNSSLAFPFLDFDIYQFPENEHINSLIKGLNRQQFLIIYNSTIELEEELITYLQKILAAISIQLKEDTLFLNLPKEMKISISHLINSNGITKILLFGISPELLSLNIQIPPYAVFPFLEKKWLWADNLLDIFLERQQTNRPKAGALWTALNTMQKD